jgi:hypothetical protein
MRRRADRVNPAPASLAAPRRHHARRQQNGQWTGATAGRQQEKEAAS